MDLAQNKKALFDYEILEKYQAGLVLTGQEVKSVKNSQISLKGAFVTFHNGDAYLTNANISKYQPAGPLPDYDPTHSRRLLLRKNEIKRLMGKAQEEGLTIVPIRVYSSNRFVKVELAVGRGRKKYDKREILKRRDAQKEIRRAIKSL